MSAPRHDAHMDLLVDVRRTLGAVADKALDLALPASCAGCGQEGKALCRECRPALDVRLAAEPGVPIGLPADLPAPLLQLEWCAPFTGVTRRALHALKYDGERRLAPFLGAAVARRWARAGAAGDALVPVPASPDRGRGRAGGVGRGGGTGAMIVPYHAAQPLVARSTGRPGGTMVAQPGGGIADHRQGQELRRAGASPRVRPAEDRPARAPPR